MDTSPDKQNTDSVFSNAVYNIDFYQRDYKWTSVPVQWLLDDIAKTNLTAILRQNGITPVRSW